MIWSDTHIYTFSIYLETSPSFCIYSRMFTPLHDYLDHSSIHGIKTMSRLRAIYSRWWQDQRLWVLFIATLVPLTGDETGSRIFPI